ncbi:3-oxoacyl-[acyl-carrier-protein] synthase-3 [Nocardia transvalensis]|uniref:3-oxoacyl-[acyl-carrier-protein] synthase-3 n=1 Tax=Nocardia transvalensis TaxID=37333 RepID=A0A7W9UGC7_9NOCA|nr:ketoacyl-ACP synthase III [Nocardia transvalensis]MBB5912139.1 3-oxoacyl-[acyl-carrier-protein] synthase-3 [Nocardia transvalensis]
MTRVGVLGTGAYLPERVVTNSEVGIPAGVDSDWIIRKTAIRERRWALPGQATSDLATRAALGALDAAGIGAGELTAIVVATSTPDHSQPPTAAFVQHTLSAHAASAFDMNAVCSGFVFALATMEAAVARAGGGYGLVVGADTYSRILDRGDRRTVVLFGDGAGAAVVGPAARGGIQRSSLHTFGALTSLIQVPAGGSRRPYDPAAHELGAHYFTMDGRGVREFVADRLPVLIKQFLHDSGASPDDVTHLIPHQANGVLLAQLVEQLGLGKTTVHTTVPYFGNTGAASIPITLDSAARSGSIRPGEKVLLVGFGGGMSVGLTLLEW